MRAPWILALVVGCTVTACSTHKETGLAIDSNLVALVPPDTVFLAGANVEKIKDTRVYQKLLNSVDLPQLEQFANTTGVDPRKDLHQIISASNGKDTVLLARGNFSKASLQEHLKTQGAQPFAYKGRSLYGDQNGSVILWDDNTVVAGNTLALKQMVDRPKGQGGLPQPLREQLKALSPGDQIWVATSGGVDALGLAVPQNSNLANVTQILKGIQAVRLGIDASSGLNAEAAAVCDSDKSARRIHDALRGLIGFGRLNTPDNQPDLLKLYDAIHVTQTQNQTDAVAHIDPDLVDKFLDLWLKKK